MMLRSSVQKSSFPSTQRKWIAGISKLYKAFHCMTTGQSSRFSFQKVSHNMQGSSLLPRLTGVLYLDMGIGVSGTIVEQGSTASDMALNCARGWLNQCLQSHSLCNRQASDDLGDWYPTR